MEADTETDKGVRWRKRIFWNNSGVRWWNEGGRTLQRARGRWGVAAPAGAGWMNEGEWRGLAGSSRWLVGWRTGMWESRRVMILKHRGERQRLAMNTIVTKYTKTWERPERAKISEWRGVASLDKLQSDELDGRQVCWICVDSGDRRVRDEAPRPHHTHTHTHTHTHKETPKLLSF